MYLLQYSRLCLKLYTNVLFFSLISVRFSNDVLMMSVFCMFLREPGTLILFHIMQAMWVTKYT